MQTPPRAGKRRNAILARLGDPRPARRSALPGILFDHLPVTLVMWPERQHLETVRASFQRTGDFRRDSDRVELSQLGDLAVKVDASAATNHDVDLLGLIVAVGALALARLDSVECKTRVLGLKRAPRE